MEASFCGADKGEIADQHFQVEHLQQAGQKLLEALIIYFKVTPGKSEKKGELTKDDIKVTLKVNEIEAELKENQKLI